MREIELELDQAAEFAATQAAPLFNLFGWTWYDSDQAPTHNRIQKSIQESIESAKKYGAAGTGRFMVRREENEVGTDDYTISLELAHVYDVPRPEGRKLNIPAKQPEILACGCEGKCPYANL